jgi:hypothetical protein
VIREEGSLLTERYDAPVSTVGKQLVGIGRQSKDTRGFVVLASARVGKFRFRQFIYVRVVRLPIGREPQAGCKAWSETGASGRDNDAPFSRIDSG